MNSSASPKYKKCSTGPGLNSSVSGFSKSLSEEIKYKDQSEEKNIDSIETPDEFSPKPFKKIQET